MVSGAVHHIITTRFITRTFGICAREQCRLPFHDCHDYPAWSTVRVLITICRSIPAVNVASNISSVVSLLRHRPLLLACLLEWWYPLAHRVVEVDTACGWILWWCKETVKGICMSCVCYDDKEVCFAGIPFLSRTVWRCPRPLFILLLFILLIFLITFRFLRYKPNSVISIWYGTLKAKHLLSKPEIKRLADVFNFDSSTRQVIRRTTEWLR